MRHEIIHTADHLLVVDDSEIKEGGYDFSINYKTITYVDEGRAEMHKTPAYKGLYKKIIAHLPLNNSPILEGVDVLPPLDNIRYDFAEMFYNILKATYPTFDEWVEAIEYNKDREKYEYTKEDIENAFNSGRGYGVPDDIKDLNSFMKSLSQPKMPIAFECEESIFFATNAFSSDITLTAEGLQDTVLIGVKKTTNSQGQTQWVGKYIYD